MPTLDAANIALQPAQERGRPAASRSARSCSGTAKHGAYADADGHRAPHRQHDGALQASMRLRSGPTFLGLNKTHRAGGMISERRPDQTLLVAQPPWPPSAAALHQIVVVGGGAAGLELATRLGDTARQAQARGDHADRPHAHAHVEAEAARDRRGQHGHGCPRGRLPGAGALAPLSATASAR